MHIVIAAAYQHLIDPWQQALADVADLEFRAGAMPEVGFGCDAQILPAYLAHDRYGGTHDTQHAQLLENLRGDGAPDLIIVTPAYAAGGQPTDLALLEERLLFIFRECLTVAGQATGADKPRITSVLLHLGVLGIDKYDVDSCTRALRRALDTD